MHPLGEVVTAAPEDPVLDLLPRLEESPVRRALVLDHSDRGRRRRAGHSRSGTTATGHAAWWSTPWVARLSRRPR
ncbi:hypothetical protein [Streptomyces alanosinicus]